MGFEGNVGQQRSGRRAAKQLSASRWSVFHCNLQKAQGATYSLLTWLESQYRLDYLIIITLKLPVQVHFLHNGVFVCDRSFIMKLLKEI